MRAFIQRPRLRLMGGSAVTAVVLLQVLPAWGGDQTAATADKQTEPSCVF